MKRRVSKIVLILSLVAVIVCGMALVACNETTEEPTAKKIYISSKVQTLRDGVNAPITVITDPEGEEWDITISDPTMVAYDEAGKYLYVVGRVTEATEITVTVSLVTDPTVTASKSFAVVSSGRDNSDMIVFTADTYTVAVGAPARLEVITSNDEDYNITVSKPELVACRNGVLTVIEAPEEDTTVTVTASLVNNSAIKYSKDFIVKAKGIVSTLTLKSDVSEIAVVKEGEAKKKAQLTVTTSVPGEEYVLSASSDKVKINDDNTVEIVGDLPYDLRVTITAKLKDHSDVTSSINLVLRALQKEGQVSGANGLKLTTAMLNAITNSSITVTGNVLDYYTVYGDAASSFVTGYDTSVMMENGKWKGSWSISGRNNATVITDLYYKGTAQVNYAYDRETQQFYSGTEMYKRYINKDNVLASQLVTTTDSIPVAWEQQHLYNPMDHFATNVQSKFEFRDDFDLASYGYSATEYAAFKYIIDESSIDEWYYATYIAFAFTPMVSDTMVDIYVIVGADGVVGLVAATETQYYGGTDEEGNPIEGENPTSESYTVINLKFSNIGTTVVTDPEVYVGTIANPTTKAERENNEAMAALREMITKMSGATNYTFMAADVSTYSPSLDESDYQISSPTNASAPINASSATRSNQYAQKRAATGTIGTEGSITADAIMLAITDKYDYGMAGDLLYYTNYSGYKQVTTGENATYDAFSYSYDLDALAGTKQYKGNITDIIPQFNFSPDIFKYKSGQTVQNQSGDEVYVYELTLRDVTIAKEVAPEISMYRYAGDASSDVGSEFSLWVDEHGNLVKSVYQYSLVYGTYLGYVETTYSKVGTTVIPSNAFDGYVARAKETSWSQFTDRSFYKKHSTLCASYNCLQANGEYDHSGHTGTAQEVLEFIFPETYASMPAPTVFTDVFGDNLHAAGFNWRSIYDASGTETGYKDYMSFTLSYDKTDENARIIQSDYTALMGSLETALATYGFALSATNSNINKDPLVGGSRYATFNNQEAGIQIVVENNYTRYFWVYVYHTGDWTLN